MAITFANAAVVTTMAVSPRSSLRQIQGGRIGQRRGQAPARGFRGARGSRGVGRGAGGAGAGRGGKKTVTPTAAELDAELDAYISANPK